MESKEFANIRKHYYCNGRQALKERFLRDSFLSCNIVRTCLAKTDYQPQPIESNTAFTYIQEAHKTKGSENVIQTNS